jgi:alpha-glucoside transport system substrate-binding protein
MLHGKKLHFLLILLAITAFAAVAFVACEDEEEAEIGTVDVLGIWGDEELVSFEAMVAPWETDTGGSMEFTGTRDITAVLTTRVEGGNPPDVAIPAEVGRFQQFAEEGKLVALSACEGLEEAVKANYPQGFIDLGTVDGVLYGFFMKADTKGTIWYNPGFFADNGYEALTVASTFDDLVALSDQILADDTPPWSIGVESAEASGWPGTDWIQQILLNEAGGAVYDGVIDGSVPFTDAQVKDAWEKFGQIALTEGYTVQEGAEGINATNFVDATYPPFEDPPTAAMVYLGGFASGFITDQFPDAVAGEDFDFFPFPGGAVTGGANIVYAFDDSETTCSFLNYLASAEAQGVWVDRGGFTSVNTQVSLDSYPDAVSQAQAEQLAGAEVFRFDLDDAIGGALQGAFFAGVTEYLANPDDLDSILADIEASRE